MAGMPVTAAGATAATAHAASPAAAGAVHVAIVLPRYVTAILAGLKTIEARFSRVRCEPFGRVRTGERVYFKECSGPFRATAVVRRVERGEELTPADVRRLRRVYGRQIRADAAFWASKSSARYATLLWLDAVEPVLFGPRYRARDRRAWYVLPARADVYPDCLEPLLFAGPPTPSG